MTASMISTASTSYVSTPENSIWFHLIVVAHKKQWIIYRNYENFRYLDKFLHDCIFDRKFSGLEELQPVEFNSSDFLASSPTASTPTKKSFKSSDLAKQLRETCDKYLKGFHELTFKNSNNCGPVLNCGPILNWFEVSAFKLHINYL